MKTHFVCDLQDGQAFACTFLVRQKEIRSSPRTGKSWLEIGLVDRTGNISGKMWEGFEAIAKTFECDDVIRVRARVKIYNTQKELTIEQIVCLRDGEYELGDYLAHTKYDLGELWAQMRAAVAGMKNPWLQKLLNSFLDDPETAAKMKRAPAAMTMHHAFVGGLLEHVVGLIGLARDVAAHYTELDGDLLLTGVVLHDIGKLDELSYGRSIEYSTEGRLLGHITIGARKTREKIATIPGFPSELANLVEHLILSHHGSLEFGSPTLPQTREAVALHFLDDMDSKMAAMRSSLDAPGGRAADWTERNPALRREILRTEKYLSKDVQPRMTATGGPASGSSNTAAAGVTTSGNGDTSTGKTASMFGDGEPSKR
jgi:3'-5' exoribonuclease